MATIGEKPFLEYQIQWVKKHGIDSFVLCVGYLHQHIRDYFGDGRRWGARIEYSTEDDLLGTGGALKRAEKHLRGAFLVLNGDSFLDADLGKLMLFHNNAKTGDGRCLGSIVLTAVPDPRQFGSVRTDQANKIVSFDEKIGGSDGANQISAGIYLLEPRLLTLIRASKKVSLEREIFPSILEADLHLFGYPADGFFADIGTPSGYRRFQDYVKQGTHGHKKQSAVKN
jgi:NDP-sugar pyrophosphorylase family protein